MSQGKRSIGRRPRAPSASASGRFWPGATTLSGPKSLSISSAGRRSRLNSAPGGVRLKAARPVGEPLQQGRVALLAVVVDDAVPGRGLDAPVAVGLARFVQEADAVLLVPGGELAKQDVATLQRFPARGLVVPGRDAVLEPA